MKFAMALSGEYRWTRFALLLSSFLILSLVPTISYTQTFDFEDGTKASYAVGNQTLNGVSWELKQALIGDSPGFDRFNGSKALRIRYRTSGDNGAFTMLSDVAGGIGSISFLYAQYRTDASPVLAVEYSTNGGSTWTQVGSNIVTQGVTTLTPWCEDVGTTVPTRMRIIVVSGTSNSRRANIDDLEIKSTSCLGGSPPNISLTGSNITCTGGNDGSISSSVADGTSPFGYLWSTGATGSSLTSLTAGTYTVTVTDNNGLTDVSSVTLTQPSLAVSALASVQSSIACNGGSGSVTVTPSGGAGSYTYQWNDASNQTSQTAVGVLAGSYSVTVTDGSGCTGVGGVTLNEPSILSGGTISGN